MRLVEHFSQMKLGNKDVEPDVLGNVYEYLLKKFNEEAPQRAGEFYTPREVVRVMVEILNPEEGFEVYDPCCGSGGMLIVSHYHLANKGKDPKKLFLYGQEINVDTWTIAMRIHAGITHAFDCGDHFNSGNKEMKMSGGHDQMCPRVVRPVPGFLSVSSTQP